MLVKVYRYSIFILIVGVLSIIAWLSHSLVELAIMLTCFLIAKEYYEYRYHCKSAIQCLLLSIGVFILGVRITLPASVSYSCAGLCGLCIAHIAQWVAHKKRINYEYAILLEEKRKTDVYSMSEEELRVYCRRNHLDDIDEEIVVQRLIYHRKGIDLYEKIGYSKPQMIRREKRIESTLNIKLK